MARVVVDVMPKPDILDPQGKAVTGALARLGFSGVSVRQGKRFELELEGELTDGRLADVRKAAETLLANTVIETFAVRVEQPATEPGEQSATEPVEQPAPEPGEQSATEPVEQPATEPGEQSATEPVEQPPGKSAGTGADEPGETA